MASVSFKAFGHRNVLATHKSTYEFTKESELTKKGDCIVGVRSDFDTKALVKLARENNSARLRIFFRDEEVFWDEFILNQNFKSEGEVVIRMSNFLSERTLGIKCMKSAKQIPRGIVKRLQNPCSTIRVVIDSK